jgi:hypothetical protein
MDSEYCLESIHCVTHTPRHDRRLGSAWQLHLRRLHSWAPSPTQDLGTLSLSCLDSRTTHPNPRMFRLPDGPFMTTTPPRHASVLAAIRNEYALLHLVNSRLSPFPSCNRWTRAPRRCRLPTGTNRTAPKSPSRQPRHGAAAAHIADAASVGTAAPAPQKPPSPSTAPGLGRPKLNQHPP